MVVVVAVRMSWQFLRTTPLSHDHPMHILKAWIFWNEMLASGRLRGWSHTLAFGFPYGELTPPGAEMWVALFRILTLGQLSWLRTYGIAFAGVLMLAAFATYAFAARFFGRWAGAVAAMLMILDPGAWAEGGWLWWLEYGVWPVTLSLAFALLALLFVDRILSAAPGRNVVWAAILVALSILVHQVPLLVYAVAVPGLLLDRLGAGLPRRRLRRLVLAFGLGTALAGFYFLPMLTHSAVTLDLGAPWIPNKELAKRLADLTIFEHMWPLTTSLMVIGLVLALRARRPRSLGLAVTMTALFLLASSDVIYVLHAERISRTLLKIEGHRMVQVAKLFGFAFAGYAVVTIVASPVWTRPWHRHRIGFAAMARVVIALAIVAPFVAPVLRHLRETQLPKDVPSEGKTPFWNDLRSFFTWARTERASSQGFYRIAYDLPFYDHLSLIAPVFTQTPMYKVGIPPSQQFRSLPTTNESGLYQNLSVKWVLSDYELAGSDFVPVSTFGALKLYRFAPYHGAPFSLVGPGTAELVNFEPEGLVFHVRDTQPGSHLIVHVAGYDRWQATVDGISLPIRPANAWDNEYPFLMEIPAHDGELVLRYVPRAADRLGMIASLAAMIVLAFAFWTKPSWLLDRLGPIEARSERHSASLRKLALAAVALLVVLAIVRMASPRVLLPPTSLFTQEPQLSVAGHTCESIGVLAWGCDGYHASAKPSAGIYGNHYCVESPTGPLALTMKNFTGDVVYGRYDGGYQDPRGNIQISVDGKKIAETGIRGPWQGLQFLMYDLRPYWKPEGQTLRIEVDGSALHCLDFSTDFY